jgi:alpha-tubulin suppressor-like RCC1 family protein
VLLAAGDSHTCGVSSDGAVKCWGRNTSGELGNGATANGSFTPVTAVAAGPTALELGLGDAHSCASVGPDVRCWGANDHGQLGDGHLAGQPAGVASYTAAQTVTAIAAGSAHTCALASDGHLACWGDNSDGQLGSPTGWTTGFAPVAP